ncbi:MAG TPA: hypothetical protein DIT25_01725 [Candidatus Moranbacteria bacterium]|nr:hypothetical protein [Candidatus Moranbacteria bacterium]
MTCPKCNDNSQWGNFCSKCGNQLKEMCPECNKMEAIDRKECIVNKERKKKEAMEKREEYINSRMKKRPRWNSGEGILWMGMLAGSIAAGLIFHKMVYGWGIFFKQFPWSFLIMPASVFLFFVCVGAYFQSKIFDNLNQREKELIQEFFQKFPHYAEIIKKAEEKK